MAVNEHDFESGPVGSAIKPFVKRTSKMNFCDESKTIPNAEYRDMPGNESSSTL